MILKEQALQLRALGLSIFPVSEDGKVPLVPWKKYQTELPTQEEISEWFSSNNKGIGLATGTVSGAWMLDFDLKKHPEARKFLAKWYPRTWKEKTASGGIHMYFKMTPALEQKQLNTQSQLFVGVDTRGTGGYSKIAPSVGYTWINSPENTPLADAPQWLIDLLPDKAGTTSSVATVESQKGWLNTELESIIPMDSVKGRNPVFRRVIAVLKNKGLSQTDVTDLLAPWGAKYDYAGKLSKLIADQYARYPVPQQEVQDEDASSIDNFLAEMQKVEWIVPGLISKQSLGFVAGLPESRKTWLLMDLAIEAARGGGKWVGKFDVNPAKVLFIDQERYKGETQRRLRSVITSKGLDSKALSQNLFVKCGTTIRLNLQNSFDAFRRELERLRPDLILFDSLATAHTSDENNRQSIQDVLEKVKSLRNEFGCTFVFISHENKFAFHRDGEDSEPSIAEMAGSVAIPAAAEFVLTVRKQDAQSSLVHMTKNTVAVAAEPFRIRVIDVDNGIRVESY